MGRALGKRVARLIAAYVPPAVPETEHGNGVGIDVLHCISLGLMVGSHEERKRKYPSRWPDFSQEPLFRDGPITGLAVHQATNHHPCCRDRRWHQSRLARNAYARRDLRSSSRTAGGC